MKARLAFLKALTGTRENEGARLFLMSAYLLLIIACYTTTKAVRDSLFIIEIGPSQLPYLYILTAAVMAMISAIYPRALRRVGLYSLIRLTSFGSIASLIFFWWLVAFGGRASFFVLYVWVSLFGVITASQAWSLASQVFDAREARRSFAWIGLGGVVGGIVGGSLARVLAPWTGTEALLPICAGLMLVTVAILHRLTPSGSRNATEEAKAESASSSASGSAVLAQINRSPYLSMLVVLLLSGVVVEAFIDYQFKFIAHQVFDSKDHLTAFFGTIASYGGMIALVIQTLVTGRLLRRFGVGAAIVLLPSALLAGFIILAVQPALWAVSILKLIDGSLSYSVHRSGMELLYIPIPAKVRASAKALIDLLVDRAGRALGGLFLLLLTAGLSLSVSALSLVASICLAVWLVIALLVRRNYVQAFRVALEKKVIEPEALEVSTLDSTIVQALLRALSSSDDRQVLYALDLLAGTHPARWRHFMPSLVEHSSPAVRSRTIALLTERRLSSAALVSTKLSDPELDVRVEAVRHLCVVSPDPDTELKKIMMDESYPIVLAAIHGMAKYQLGKASLIDEGLIEKALSTTGEDRVSARTAAARALAITGLAGKQHFLETLLEDSSVAVVQDAIRTVAEVRYERAIPALVSMLARAPLRREAREALLKFGPPAFPELQARFRDDQTPIEVRSRIPKVLSFTGRQDIADFLLAAVHHFPSLDIPLLKALNRMRTRFEEIKFDREQVYVLIQNECERYQQLKAIRGSLRSSTINEGASCSSDLLALLDRAICERLSEDRERVFRFLALLYSPADIYSVYFNLDARPSLKASALEFLDNLIELPLRAMVMPILEESQEPDETQHTNEARLSREEAMLILHEGDDEWLQAIVREAAARSAGVLFSESA